jgi:hypothetical protein
MATTVERATPQTSSTGTPSKDASLAAPNGRTTSKGGVSSSTASITSSYGPDDGSSDVRSSGDGTLDKFKSNRSDDGQSETSSHRRRMSKLFKKGKRRRKSVQDDISLVDPAEEIPPLPDMPPQKVNVGPPFQSEESLGLHKSVASSLLTEDSDAESYVPYSSYVCCGYNYRPPTFRSG